MKTASLPEHVRPLAAEGFWLPEPPQAGWVWATIEEMLDDDALDQLVEATARELDAPVIAFSVFDGDCSLLVAASPAEIECRLVFDHESFDGYSGSGQAAKISRGGAKRFAAWSASFAPRSVSASVTNRYCKEDRDPLQLLEAVGLYPPPPPRTTPAWEDWYPDDMQSAGSRRWDGNGHSHLVGEREFAILPEPASEFDGPPGPWILFLAHDVVLNRADTRLHAYLTFVAKDTVYGLRLPRHDVSDSEVEKYNAEMVAFFARGMKGEQPKLRVVESGFDDVETAKRYLGASYCGRVIGDWSPVPDEVGRNMAETVAWLVARASQLA